MSKILEKIKMHNLSFADYVKGKNVAIIGPASSVLFEKNGQEIDEYDIIIRINRGCEIIDNLKDFVGSRTDILYNSLDFDPLTGGDLFKMEDPNIKFICCPYPIKERTFKEKIFLNNGGPSLFEKYQIRFIDEEIYYNLRKETNSRINSGFGAIVDILNHPVNNIYISGIDFYRSVYCENYNPDRKWGNDFKIIEEDLEFKIYDDDKHHHPDRQYNNFKKLYLKNKERIVLDGFMSKIIKDDKYDKWDTIPRRAKKC
jgi:hypothetical protein